MSEGHIWIRILWASMLFAIVASPLSYKLTGQIFGDSPATQQPTWSSLLIHTLIFAGLLRLMMFLPIFKKEEGWHNDLGWGYRQGFQGLVGDGEMLRCNAAQAFAEKAQCPTCVHAAQTCMQKPFDPECAKARKDCLDVCNSKEVGQVVNCACNMHGPQDWM